MRLDDPSVSRHHASIVVRRQRQRGPDPEWTVGDDRRGSAPRSGPSCSTDSTDRPPGGSSPCPISESPLDAPGHWGKSWRELVTTGGTIPFNRPPRHQMLLQEDELAVPAAPSDPEPVPFSVLPVVVNTATPVAMTFIYKRLSMLSVRCSGTPRRCCHMVPSAASNQEEVSDRVLSIRDGAEGLQSGSRPGSGASAAVPHYHESRSLDVHRLQYQRCEPPMGTSYRGPRISFTLA